MPSNVRVCDRVREDLRVDNSVGVDADVDADHTRMSGPSRYEEARRIAGEIVDHFDRIGDDTLPCGYSESRSKAVVRR